MDTPVKMYDYLSSGLKDSVFGKDVLEQYGMLINYSPMLLVSYIRTRYSLLDSSDVLSDEDADIGDFLPRRDPEPLGRCCQGGFAGPVCLVNTEAECMSSGQFISWTEGENCDIPDICDSEPEEMVTICHSPPGNAGVYAPAMTSRWLFKRSRPSPASERSPTPATSWAWPSFSNSARC